MANKLLQGVGVLVTRPALQAVDLIDAIEIAGGRAIRFPVIDIVPRGKEVTQVAAAALPPPDIVVFVSSNAVLHGLQYADSAATAAIGPATAAAIRAGGRAIDIAPTTGFDSESLLKHPDLRDVSGKHVLIVRGKYGRELLSNTLRARGAVVNTLAVYDRALPEIDAAALKQVESSWQQGEIDVITIMSIESLRNLIRMLPATIAAELDRVPLVTPAARVIKEVLKRYPAARTALASGPDAGAIVAAIVTAIIENR